MDFADVFQKNIVIASKSIFFEVLVFFRPVLVVSYLQIGLQQTNNSLNYSIFTKTFLWDIQSLKTIGCDRDLKTSRPRLAKMGLATETKSRDSISGICIS